MLSNGFKMEVESRITKDYTNDRSREVRLGLATLQIGLT